MATISQPYQRAPVFPQIVAALVSGITLFFAAVIVWTLGYQLIYAGRIFPGVSVAGVDLSGMTPSDAAIKLNQALSYPISGKVLFRDGEKAWVATPAELGMVFDPSSSAVTAYGLGRSGGLFGALSGQIRAGGSGANIPPVMIFDQRVAYQYLSQISSQIDQPMVEAGLSLDGTNVVATPGQIGRELKIDATLIYLGAQLQTFSDGEVPLVVQEIQPQILDVSGQANVARQILSQPLTLVVPNSADGSAGPFVYDVQVLAQMLGVQRVDGGVQVILNTNGLREMLEPVKARTDRLPKNAKFIFNDETRQLDAMENSQTGLVMDVDASIAAINDALLRGEHTVPLVVAVAEPEISSTTTGAELGITELIQSQTSYFYGSSEERIQNIQAAAASFHGVLVAPGEIFSMGAAMGDVSLENGFAEALIIYGGRTIKGVGGGVCQVSTTLFRTVFFGGFPIVERYPHAYRVSYYELKADGGYNTQLAGLDATVFVPLVDFKFINDSPNWLLMETYVNPTARTLTWKFYSTGDGRSVEWSSSGLQNIEEAPPPVYEENSDLAKGEVKQVDWEVEGADVTVTRTVTRDGQVLYEDTITTHYLPWQAVYQYGPGTKDMPPDEDKDKKKDDD